MDLNNKINDSNMIQLPRSEYEALCLELAQYRNRFGPLNNDFSESDNARSPDGDQPKLVQELVEPEVNQNIQGATESKPSSEDSILAILSQSDSAIETEISLEGLENHLSANSEPIRHYGFKRAKVGGSSSERVTSQMGK